jgi:catechol 2,3-dioxygenase-like lactoylglutathione lyase family enzyme
MLDHVGIEVSDYPRSKAFYEAALAPLGISLLMEFAESAAGFGSETEIGPKPYSGGTIETPAHAWRRRTRRGAASSVGRIAPLFGLPASLPRLVRRSPVAHAGFDSPSWIHARGHPVS